METNILVYHKRLKSLGIGCTAKIMKRGIKTNFGQEDSMLVKEELLTPIDTSDCKTVSLREFQSKILMSRNNKCPDNVIVGNLLHRFVGIGWTVTRVVNEADLKKFPRVIQ